MVPTSTSSEMFWSATPRHEATVPVVLGWIMKTALTVCPGLMSPKVRVSRSGFGLSQQVGTVEDVSQVTSEPAAPTLKSRLV